VLEFLTHADESGQRKREAKTGAYPKKPRFHPVCERLAMKSVPPRIAQLTPINGRKMPSAW